MFLTVATVAARPDASGGDDAFVVWHLFFFLLCSFVQLVGVVVSFVFGGSDSHGLHVRRTFSFALIDLLEYIIHVYVCVELFFFFFFHSSLRFVWFCSRSRDLPATIRLFRLNKMSLAFTLADFGQIIINRNFDAFLFRFSSCACRLPVVVMIGHDWREGQNEKLFVCFSSMIRLAISEIN